MAQFNLSDLFYDYFTARYYIEDIGMIGASFTFLNGKVNGLMKALKGE